MNTIFSFCADELANGYPICLITVLRSQGSTPRGAGTMMAVSKSGNIQGTVGGGASEYQAQLDAKELLASGASGFRHYNLSNNEAATLGMVCGGNFEAYFQICLPNASAQELFLSLAAESNAQMKSHFVLAISKTEWTAFCIRSQTEVLCQAGGKADMPSLPLTNRPIFQRDGEIAQYSHPLTPSGMVYVIGAGHVAQALVPILKSVHFPCVVVDSRAEFANSRNFPNTDVRVLNYPTAMNELSITPNDYIVIMTRGHISDFDMLADALRTPARYIGMIGSRKKISHTYTRLIMEQGFSYSELSRIHAPIGLPIGGETPEEIAISVTGELILERSGGR